MKFAFPENKIEKKEKISVFLHAFFINSLFLSMLKNLSFNLINNANSDMNSHDEHHA
jgi:hypothetical protein